MTFTYTGSKTGNIFKVAQGFFFFIALASLLGFFIYADWDSISEYSIPLLMIIGFFIAYLINLAKQNSKLLQSNIDLIDNTLIIEKNTKISLDNFKLLTFYHQNNFDRYILYDINSIITIYSTTEDVLYHNIKSELEVIRQDLKSTSIYNEEILLACSVDDKVIYNLESGTLDISLKNFEELYLSPKYFYVDPNFK